MARATWTIKRNELLVDASARDLTAASMLPRLNALPGAPIVNVAAIYSQKTKLRDEIMAARAARQNSRASSPANIPSVAAGRSPATGGGVSSLNLPPAERQPVALFEGPAISVPYEDARKWAVTHRLSNRYTGLDLIKVNAFRRGNGLPAFEIEGAL